MAREDRDVPAECMVGKEAVSTQPYTTHRQLTQDQGI
jgi:hypothetical protein